MNPNDQQTPTRSDTFDCAGPADLDLRLNAGRIDVRAAEVARIRVDVSVDDQDVPEDRAARAIQGMQITFSEPDRKLVLRTPRELRRTRLAVMVETPQHSRLVARVHSGSIVASGALSGLDATAGAGDVTADQIDGDVLVRTGSGDVRLGPVTGKLRTRSGSGAVDVAAIDGDEATLHTGSGDVRLGMVNSDVTLRAGSGDLTIAEVAHGRLSLATGSGDVWVAIRPGVAAELDLVSGSGQARSELGVSNEEPAAAPEVRVRVRTGSGDAVVTRATA